MLAGSFSRNMLATYIAGQSNSYAEEKAPKLRVSTSSSHGEEKAVMLRRMINNVLLGDYPCINDHPTTPRDN